MKSILFVVLASLILQYVQQQESNLVSCAFSTTKADAKSTMVHFDGRLDDALNL